MNMFKFVLQNGFFPATLLATGFITLALCFFYIEETRCAAIVTAGPDWEYTGHMLDKISARWQPPKQLVGLHRLNLALSLDNDGRLLECRVQKGSGLDALDASACAAARAASPYGPPPSRGPAVVHFSFWTGGLDSRVPVSEDKEHYNPIFAERAVENARFANERAQARAEAAAKSSGKKAPGVSSKPLPESGQPVTHEDKAVFAKEQAKARAEAAIKDKGGDTASPTSKQAAETAYKSQVAANQLQESGDVNPVSEKSAVLDDKKSVLPFAQTGSADDKAVLAKERAKARAEAAIKDKGVDTATPAQPVVPTINGQEQTTPDASASMEKEIAQKVDKASSSTQTQRGPVNSTLVKDQSHVQAVAPSNGQTISSLQDKEGKATAIAELPKADQAADEKLVQKNAEPVRDLPAPLPASPQPTPSVATPQKELSETEKLMFEKYEARITSILRKGIFVPRGPKPDTLYSTVQLELDKRGKILKSSILTSSGEERLDQNILKAIQPGKILPPPPAGKNNQFILTFSLARK